MPPIWLEIFTYGHLVTGTSWGTDAFHAQNYFFRPNLTPDETFKNYRGKINVALCCDLLFVIYRYQPATAMDTFPLCLAPDRVDAVKLSAVDALVTIMVEVRAVLF
jgi:hypothetical protein